MTTRPGIVAVTLFTLCFAMQLPVRAGAAEHHVKVIAVNTIQCLPSMEA